MAKSNVVRAMARLDGAGKAAAMPGDEVRALVMQIDLPPSAWRMMALRRCARRRCFAATVAGTLRVANVG